MHKLVIRMLRDEPQRSISEIALEAGFGSIRSFNREFLSIYGVPPHRKRSESVADV